MWRPVQPHAAPDVVELLLGHAAVARKKRVRAAGRQLHEDEREEGDPEEQGDRFQDAARDEADHGALDEDRAALVTEGGPVSD